MPRAMEASSPSRTPSRSYTEPDERRARLIRLGALGLWFVGMVAYGLPHAIWRHFHVDEIQIAYNVALWGVHRLDGYANYAAPFMVPLAWMIGGLSTTAAMLLVLRVAFFVVFMVNLIAIAVAQPYFRSRAGVLCVLAGVTLLHPFWEHGFEIRHDVLLVTGSILLYGIAQRVVRRRDAEPWVLLAAGAIAAAMLLNAYKGVVYCVPFSGVVLLAAVAPRWREGRARAGSALARVRSLARPLAWFAAGAAASVIISLGLLAVAGHLDEFGATMSRFSGGERPYRFSPGGELVRVALDSPLVYGAAILFAVLVAIDLVRQRLRIAGATALTAAFLAWNVAALFINPVPFPYNFIHITPFVFLAALDVLARIHIEAPRARRIAVAVALSAAALLFGRSWRTEPYMTRTNEAQLSYIRAAEAMTDPARDTVLDGVGLVLSRRPPHPDWMLHSLWMPAYRAGRRTSFAEMMIEHPSPVVIGSYRWGWLPSRDLAVLHERYVRLYPELFVLGSAVAGPAGEFAIHYPGRYFVHPADGKGPLAALRVDGATLAAPAALSLAPGLHRYSGAGQAGILVHWLGPTLDGPPAVLPLLPEGMMFTNE
jgi:hypothetical protein